MDSLDHALATARDRGRVRAAEILSEPGMLTAPDFAERMAVSVTALSSLRNEGKVLAMQAGAEGWRYPEWQLNDAGKPFKALSPLTEILGGGWALFRFLRQSHPELDGMTGLDALQLGMAAEALDVAESIARGDFS